MKKLILIASLALVACSSKRDDQFCECLSISDELNNVVADVTSRALNELKDEDAAKLKDLTAKKDQKCADYEVLGGEELLKLKEACK